MRLPPPSSDRGATALRALPLGVAAGVMAGLFGVGGGTVLVPGLVLLLRRTQHQAHATSLAAIIVAAPAAALPFVREGAVAPWPAAAIAAGALTGAWLGAGLMHRLSEERLRQAFGLLLLVVSARLLIGGEVGTGGAAQALDALRLAAFGGLGLVAGGLSALMGVGGGTVMVPALTLLFGFTQHAAEGTSLLVIVPTALVGAVRHSRRGYTDWPLGLLTGTAGIGGGLLGAQVALSLDGAWLQRLFALLLLATTVQLLRRRKRRSDEAGSEPQA